MACELVLTMSEASGIGNGPYPCRSHYYIRSNRVEWLTRTKLAGLRDVRPYIHQF